MLAPYQSRNHFGRDLEHRLELRFTNEHDVAAQVADGFLGPLTHPLNVVVRIPGCIPSRLPSWSFSSGHKTRASWRLNKIMGDEFHLRFAPKRDGRDNWVAPKTRCPFVRPKGIVTEL